MSNVIGMDRISQEHKEIAHSIINSFRDMQGSAEDAMLAQIQIFESFTSMNISSIEVERDQTGRAVKLTAIANL